MTTEQTLHIEDTGAQAPEQPELGKPKRPRMREATVNPVMGFSDEQLVNIAKNMSLETTKLIFEHFDPSSAAGATAMVAAIGQLAKIAQDDIKLKQDQEAAGQIAGAANAVAQIFTQVIDNASGKRPLEQERVEGSEGKRLEDDEQVELAANETFVGVEHIDQDQIMAAGTDAQHQGAKSGEATFG